jgi:hypothetical protein
MFPCAARPPFLWLALPCALHSTETIAQTVVDANNPTDIVVTASWRGAAKGNPIPLRRLNERDMEAFAGRSIDEVVTRLQNVLAPSGIYRDARPITLLNGERITNQAAIGDFPSEAVERIDVLKPEEAHNYGFNTAVPVMNIVLKKQFTDASVVLSGEKQTSAAGLTTSGQISGLKLAKTTRIWITARRDLTPFRFGNPANPDERGARSLTPRAEALSTDVRVSDDLLGIMAATLRGTMSRQSSDSRLGIAQIERGSTDGLYNQAQFSEQLGFGFDLSRSIGPWFLSFSGDVKTLGTGGRSTVSYQHNSSELSSNKSKSMGSTLLLSAAGPMFDLPGGPAIISLNGDLQTDAIKSQFTSGNNEQGSRTVNRSEKFGLKAELPILKGGETGSGRLILSAAASVIRTPTFGWLFSRSIIVQGSPFAGVSLTFDTNSVATAPSETDLKAPIEETPNIRLYDPIRGADALVTLARKGNPSLRPSRTNSWRMALTAQPIAQYPVIISASMSKTATRGQIISTSSTALSLQRRFPGRFQRDAAGTLVKIDVSPLNLGGEVQTDFNADLSFFQTFRQNRYTVSGESAFQDPGSISASLNGSLMIDHRVDFGDGRGFVDVLGRSADVFRDAMPKASVGLQVAIDTAKFGGGLQADWRSPSLLSGGAEAPLTLVSPISFGFNFYAKPKVIFPSTHFAQGTKISFTIANFRFSRPSIRNTPSTPAFQDFLEQRSAMSVIISLQTKL